MLEEDCDYKKEMAGALLPLRLKDRLRWLFLQVFSKRCFHNLSLREQAIQCWLGWPHGVGV